MYQTYRIGLSNAQLLFLNWTLHFSAMSAPRYPLMRQKYLTASNSCSLCFGSMCSVVEVIIDVWTLPDPSVGQLESRGKHFPAKRERVFRVRFLLKCFGRTSAVRSPPYVCAGDVFRLFKELDTSIGCLSNLWHCLHTQPSSTQESPLPA